MEGEVSTIFCAWKPKRNPNRFHALSMSALKLNLEFNYICCRNVCKVLRSIMYLPKIPDMHLLL